MTFHRTNLTLALTLVALACAPSPLVAPPGDFPWKPYSPPDIYAHWHAALEDCVGISRDFDEIEWRLMPGMSWTTDDGEEVLGMWVAPNVIYLANAYIGYMPLVKHEMTHYLFGRGGHPMPPFGTCEYEYAPARVP